MKTLGFEEMERRLARRRRGGDEWPRAGTVFTVVPGSRLPRQVVFATKQSGLVGLHITELARADTTCIFHYGLTAKAEWERLRVERELGATVLIFVGDLDPLDLAVLASLVAGARTHGMKVAHLGVDDAWVSLCRRYAKKNVAARPPGLPTIKMSSFERATYRALRQLPDALPPSVGAECRALLDAGEKLETEGASNPAFYRAGFSAALEKMLRRRLALRAADREGSPFRHFEVVER